MSHLRTELGVAWHDFLRAGRPTARSRNSVEVERREQSARVGELAQNEAGEGVRVRVVLKRELGVHGQATWSGISSCVCAGPRWFAGKAELTGRPPGAARGSGRAGGNGSSR
jgi:hypothetical protein